MYVHSGHVLLRRALDERRVCCPQQIEGHSVEECPRAHKRYIDHRRIQSLGGVEIELARLEHLLSLAKGAAVTIERLNRQAVRGGIISCARKTGLCRVLGQGNRDKHATRAVAEHS